MPAEQGPQRLSLSIEDVGTHNALISDALCTLHGSHRLYIRVASLFYLLLFCPPSCIIRNGSDAPGSAYLVHLNHKISCPHKTSTQGGGLSYAFAIYST